MFGLARVEEEANKIYRVHDHPIMTLDEDQNIFLVTSSNSKFVETNKFIRNHAMKLTLITCKVDVSGLTVSCNITQTIVYVTSFRLLRTKCQEISSWHLEVS